MTRTPLKNRRHGITSRVSHGGHDFDVTFGFDECGVIREVFMRSVKEGTDLSAFLSDSCIAISLLLQHGESMESLAKAFGENRLEGEIEGPASSALGTIAREGARLDRKALEVVR